jgi:hypothetical protein
MSICPLCEAPAQSRVCEVCGHAFAAEATAPAAELPPVEGLDIPQRAEGPTAVSPLLDLEPTRFDSTAVPAPLAAEEDMAWERTQLDTVGDVTAGGLAELDSGREPADTDRTPPPFASVTCRYCRNVQAAGLLCERCGMRLPWSAKAAPTLPPLDAEALVRCPRCGVRTYQRERCASCGSELASQT